ncbi:hypothetical protein [Streptomyces sp. GC420]|uniref:hypothetical protein n=1 Tax=Streptomyces sp. GC420 TaxID=2697568 RepID=UPI001414CCB1|nr:hypothetical protein [Streptomyces sp. GC420]NBM14463.1 hypothetical protein [Streptomyces sp. GC420]
MSFDFTDAWHPTVNPSARMPVHHHRHLAVLGHTDGILNEFPRHRGGTTIRLPRIRDGRLHVMELPGNSTFAPWWLPAADPGAVSDITGIYEAALRHPHTTVRERGALARLRDDFAHRCADAGGRLTIGEALWQTADALHRELVPSLPRLALTSLTRSPVRRTIADALTRLPGGLLPTLARWAECERRPMWPLLAVTTSPQGVPLRIRLHAASRSLDLSPLPTTTDTRAPGRPVPLAEGELITLLGSGRLIPSSRLSAIAEVSLHLAGTPVRHFGNTYGAFGTLSALLSAPDTARIPCCPDDEDSWHYADLPHDDVGRYPLHLIELAACSTNAHAAAEALISASVTEGTTIPLDLKGDLDATVRAGGAGLLR